MNNKQCLGKFGENYAAKYLIKNNYKILERNYRCKFGEIDIIAEKENTIIFIEIKTRKNNYYGYPVESITRKKQKHIYNTAIYFLLNKKIRNKNIRIDAIEIYIKKIIEINHIKNIITNKI